MIHQGYYSIKDGITHFMQLCKGFKFSETIVKLEKSIKLSTSKTNNKQKNKDNANKELAKKPA